MPAPIPDYDAKTGVILRGIKKTAAEWISDNTLLRKSQVGYETDTAQIKFGDGVTLWNDLPYSSGSGGVSSWDDLTDRPADLVSGLLDDSRLATGTPDGTKFLRDDQTWQTIAAGPPGPTGALVDRDTAVATSSSIANLADWQGTITMSKGYRVMKIETDVAARVRLYGTAAKQATDVSRPIGTDPTGDHGLMFEFVTTALVLSAYLSPLVDGASFETVPDEDIPITITNRSGATDTVQVTLTYAITE